MLLFCVYSEALNKEKKRLKSEQVSSKSSLRTTVRFMFYMTRSAEEVDKVMREGFVCEANEAEDRNLLGPSEYGFQMIKHTDVALLYEYFCRTRSFYLIIARVSQ